MDTLYIFSFLHTVLWFNQKLSFVKKLIHSPLYCKTSMQTICGITDCTGNSIKLFFSFLRLVKSYV